MSWLKTHWHLVVLVLAVIMAGAVWFAWKPTTTPALTYSVSSTSGIPTATTTEILTSMVDTSGWMTYENKAMLFEIKHPIDFSFTEGDQTEDQKNKMDTGCYLLIMDDGRKFCDNKGNVNLELDTSFQGDTSKDAFEFIYSKIKEEREELGLVAPRLLKVRVVIVNGQKFYQAEYFSGDSIRLQVYLPTENGLLVYNYYIAPAENDPETEYHKEVSKAVLLSLKLKQ